MVRLSPSCGSRRTPATGTCMASSRRAMSRSRAHSTAGPFPPGGCRISPTARSTPARLDRPQSSSPLRQVKIGPPFAPVIGEVGMAWLQLVLLVVLSMTCAACELAVIFSKPVHGSGQSRCSLSLRSSASLPRGSVLRRAVPTGQGDVTRFSCVRCPRRSTMRRAASLRRRADAGVPPASTAVTRP